MKQGVVVNADGDIVSIVVVSLDSDIYLQDQSGLLVVPEGQIVMRELDGTFVIQSVEESTLTRSKEDHGTIERSASEDQRV